MVRYVRTYLGAHGVTLPRCVRDLTYLPLPIVCGVLPYLCGTYFLTSLRM